MSETIREERIRQFIENLASSDPTVTQGEAEAGTETARRAWSPLRVKQAIDALAPGGGGGNPTMSLIFTGTATASQNVVGAKGTVTDITWDNGTNAASYIDSHTDGEAPIKALLAKHWKIQVSVGFIDNGINNRTTLILKVLHETDAPATVYEYLVDDTYIRDDADTYDSGLMAAYLDIPMSVGDTIKIQVEIVDTATTTGTMSPSTTYSKIIIHAYD